MKQQIARFSPHQNGKVFAVLMAVSCTLFLLPFVLIASLFSPADKSPPLLMMLIMPVFYLVMGYIGVAVGALIYNLMFKYIGGIEFESSAKE